MRTDSLQHIKFNCLKQRINVYNENDSASFGLLIRKEGEIRKDTSDQNRKGQPHELSSGT